MKQRVRHFLACADEVSHQPLIDVEQALVLAKISGVVAFVQDAPYLGSKAQRVWQGLKDDEALASPITLAAQCGKAQCVGCVVGQVKTAFQGQTGVAGVEQPCAAGVQQSRQLIFIGRLSFQ